MTALDIQPRQSPVRTERGGIACIVVTYNSSAHIEACLAAATASGIRDILVWDNASTDDTLTKLAAVRPGVRVVRSPSNLGFGAAVNAAAKLVEPFRFLFLLNPDCVLEPGTTARLLEDLQADGRLGAVVPSMLYPDGRRGIVGGAEPTLLKEALSATGLDDVLPRRLVVGVLASLDRLGLRTGLTDLLRSAGSRELREYEWVSGFCMLVRAEAWREAGGLDERIFMYFEDVAFCRTIRGLGWTAAADGRVVALHAESSSSITPKHKGRHYRRGMWTYFSIYGDRLQRLLATTAARRWRR